MLGDGSVESWHRALAAILLVSVMVTGFVFWITPPAPNPALVWSTRVLSVVIAMGLVTWWLWARSRHDLAPDFLANRFKSCLERNGLCFAFQEKVIGDQFYLDMWYQGRYTGRCDVQLQLGPWRKRETAMRVEAAFACGPGAYGCMRLAVPVLPELQGGPYEWKMAMDVSYPEGRGWTLRYKQGESVRGLRTGWLDRLMLLALYAAGHPHAGPQKKLSTDELPRGVTAEPHPERNRHHEVWRWDADEAAWAAADDDMQSETAKG